MEKIKILLELSDTVNKNIQMILVFMPKIETGK